MHLPCRPLSENLLELAQTQAARQAVLDEVHPGPRRTALLASLAFGLAEIQAELDARDAVLQAAVEASRA
jgi:hypothetical protein